MTHYVMKICFFFFLATTSVQARNPVLLQDIVKSESFEETVLALTLSEPSGFRLKVSGQRIDLFIADTIVGSSLGLLPQEGSVQRILLAHKGSELLVSFLMARPPQEARVVTDETGQNLALHVAWNPATKNVRPAIAFSLKGAIQRDDSGRTARVAGRSRYASQWESFFREFTTPVDWQMPVAYTFPALQSLKLTPVSVVGRQAWRQGLEGRWAGVLNLLSGLEANELSPADSQCHLILSGAAYSRTGDYNAAREQYQRFRKLFPASPHLAYFGIMVACGRAQHGDPYGAASAIGFGADVARQGGAAVEGLTELLQAEVYLDTGRPRKALVSLARIAGDAADFQVARMVRLRTADARAALGRYREALKGYRQWLRRDGDEAALGPYSLVNLAVSYEQQGDIKRAERVYVLLAERSQDDAGKAVALFANARAAAGRGDYATAADRAAMVRDDYPGTEGAIRARLLAIDLQVAGSEKGPLLEYSREYAEIAATAPQLLLREEAAFKAALAKVLGGRSEEGLELLKNFRHHFASGSLHAEAEFLTLELLEPLVSKLLERGKNTEALVLIEQNRDLLATSRLSADLAVKVAVASRDLGMLSKASYIYNYLLTNAEGTDIEGRYYLPLVEVLFEAGRYQEVVRSVHRYQRRLPAGPSLSSLQLFQGRALIALGKLDEAVALLPKLQLSSLEVLVLRDQLITALAVRDGVESSALGGMLVANAPGEQASTRLLHAEYLLSEGRADKALEIYQQLIAVDNFIDQARYRSGQICLDRGEWQRGINFLTELVDKSNGSTWQNLAREVLALAKSS